MIFWRAQKNSVDGFQAETSMQQGVLAVKVIFETI